MLGYVFGGLGVPGVAFLKFANVFQEWICRPQDHTELHTENSSHVQEIPVFGTVRLPNPLGLSGRIP